MHSRLRIEDRPRWIGRGRLPAVVLVAALAVTSCAADRVPSLPENAGGAPRPSASTSTTSASQSPQCQAFAAYSLAQAAIALATPEEGAGLVPGFEAASSAVEAYLPEFAAELAVAREVTLKDATGQIGFEDSQRLQVAFAPLTAWNEANCLSEEPTVVEGSP